MSAEFQRNPRRWRRIIVVILGLAALYVAYRLTLHFMVEAKLDAIRKQGYPVTLAELDEWYPPAPAGENAADFYLEAFRHYAPREKSSKSASRMMRTEEVGDTNAPPCAQLSHFARVLSPGEVAEVVSNAEALAALQKITLVRSCRYPVKFTESIEHRLFPHLNHIRQGCRLLTAEAIMFADHGATVRAVTTLEASVNLAQSLANEPSILSQIVRLRCHKWNVGALERILSTTPLSDSEMLRLMSSFAVIDDQQSWRRALAGERCDHIELIRRLVSPSEAVWDIAGLQDRWLLAYLEQTDQISDAARSDYTVRLRTATAFADKRYLPPHYAAVLSFEFTLAGELIGDMETIAHVRCATTALAIERYRLAYGSLPQTLDELVPSYLKAVPVDPFDGQKLRYKKLATGYAVYSICKDERDDGGDEKKDITFTVER